eukprot:TRINITY_DN7224_c0_g1_i1.p1 TRINITY_DN7224_c0_g1~~TRINITY_DN7224_c0_g1_i1.p1  ORF type:complete len:442 (-),score=134.92 TRINITY_DN7224_c0_g1_i1:178-1503(-)
MNSDNHQLNQIKMNYFSLPTQAMAFPYIFATKPVLVPEPATLTANTTPAVPNPLKRKREDPSDVKLTREQLLELSSQDYEAYVKQIQQARALSSEEQREVKRQRRLIKNREYAQTSRNKKKEFVNTIQGQLDQVVAERDSLKEEVQQLKNTVEQLNQRVHELETQNDQLLKGTHVTPFDGSLASPSSSPSSPRSSPSDSPSPSSSVSNSPTQSPNRASASPRSPSTSEENSEDIDKFLETSDDITSVWDESQTFIDLVGSSDYGFSSENFLNDASSEVVNVPSTSTSSSSSQSTNDWVGSNNFYNGIYLFAILFSFSLFLGVPFMEMNANNRLMASSSSNKVELLPARMSTARTLKSADLLFDGEDNDEDMNTLYTLHLSEATQPNMTEQPHNLDINVNKYCDTLTMDDVFQDEIEDTMQYETESARNFLLSNSSIIMNID